VGKVVYDITSSKLALGLLGLVQFLPALPGLFSLRPAAAAGAAACLHYRLPSS